MFPVHIFDNVHDRDTLNAYLHFIAEMRELEKGAGTWSRDWYQIHHIAPREHFPQFSDYHWNKIALLHPDHYTATEFCAALWGGGQWIAVELMTRNPLFWRPESAVEIARWIVIAKNASDERMRRSPLYDKSFRALMKKNPRRVPWASGYRTFQVVLENPGILYQDIFEFGPGECRVKWGVQRDLQYDVGLKRMSCEPFDEKVEASIIKMSTWSRGFGKIGRINESDKRLFDKEGNFAGWAKWSTKDRHENHPDIFTKRELRKRGVTVDEEQLRFDAEERSDER